MRGVETQTQMNPLWLRIRPYVSNFVRYMHISYLEAKSQYEGTLLGILWIPVSTLSFALLLGFVFHPGGDTNPAQFFLYVLSGFVTWNFVSDSIVRSTNIIQTRFEFAVHNNLGLAGLFGKMLADRGFEFAIEFAVLILSILVLAPFSYGPPIFLLLLLIPLLCAVSLATSYLVNLLTLFYPDLGNLVSTGVRLLFFATPIFWQGEPGAEGRSFLEVFNPVSYFLMMMRQSLGLQPLQLHVWLIGVGIGAFFCVAGGVAFFKSRSFVKNLR